MNTRHIKEIDGLRALAVVSVIIFHFDKTALPFGYLGVDVFFAISGYVITRSIILQIDSNSFSLNVFFMRRIKRLFPALAVMVTASVLLCAMLIPRSNGAIKTGFAALFGMSNVALWVSGQDYFGLSTEWNPLTHTWSLGVEEQFYLAFPILLLMLYPKKRLLLAILVTIGAISLVAYIFTWDRWPIAAFYLPVFRFWELLAGALVYFLSRHIPRTAGETYRNVALYAVMAAVIQIMLSTRVAENVATVLCILSAGTLLFLCSQLGRPNALLVHETTQFVGRISYSLYLWHWPVAVFVKLVAPVGWSLAAYVLATTTLSMASFYLIERPLRNASWSLTRESALVTFPTMTAVATSIVALLWIARPVLFRGPVTMLERSFLESNSCHMPGPDGLNTCLRAGAPNGSIWLFGDSHAGNFLPPLRVVSERAGRRLQHLTGRSLFLSMIDQCDSRTCPEGGAEELIARMAKVGERNDIVVLSFARDRLWAGDEIANRFSASLERFVDQMNILGFRVFIINDIPRVCSSEGEYFSSVVRRDACLVTAIDSRNARQPLSRIYERIERIGLANVIDFHDELCERLTNGILMCSNWKSGQLLYIDASPHLTSDASLRLADVLLENLRLDLDASGVGNTELETRLKGH